MRLLVVSQKDQLLIEEYTLYHKPAKNLQPLFIYLVLIIII